MADWFDPTTWERAAAKALATPLSAVSKVRDRLSRKRATRGARGTSGNRGDKTVYVLGAGFTKAFLPDAPLHVDEFDGNDLEQMFAEFRDALDLIMSTTALCVTSGVR